MGERIGLVPAHMTWREEEGHGQRGKMAKTEPDPEPQMGTRPQAFVGTGEKGRGGCIKGGRRGQERARGREWRDREMA